MVTKVIISIIAVFVAIIVHEIAHGWVAYKFGDNTAKEEGRLSVNPINHIDLFGTILLPIILILSKTGFVFGWAKPVPVNYENLKKTALASILVSAAGIVANILLAIVCALLLKISLILPFHAIKGILSMFWLYMIVFNTILAMFNLLPIPPLDGSKILLGWSKNPFIIKFLSAERWGLICIVTLAFIIPAICQHFGVDFNPFSAYLRTTTLFITNWLI